MLNTWKNWKSISNWILSMQKVKYFFVTIYPIVQILRSSIWNWNSIHAVAMIFFVFVVLIWNCSSLMFTLYWTTTFSTCNVCVRAASMCTQIEERWTSNVNIQFWHNSCGNYTYVDARIHTYLRTICCGPSMYVCYILHTCTWR